MGLSHCLPPLLKCEPEAKHTNTQMFASRPTSSGTSLSVLHREMTAAKPLMMMTTSSWGGHTHIHYTHTHTHSHSHKLVSQSQGSGRYLKTLLGYLFLKHAK